MKRLLLAAVGTGWLSRRLRRSPPTCRRRDPCRRRARRPMCRSSPGTVSMSASTPATASAIRAGPTPSPRPRPATSTSTARWSAARSATTCSSAPWSLASRAISTGATSRARPRHCAGTCETSNTWLGTARGRIGYAFDRFLPYFTGGAAFGDIKGYVAGAGASATPKSAGPRAEAWNMPSLDNWSAKLEYLYVDLGKVTCDAACSGGTPITRRSRATSCAPA